MIRHLLTFIVVFFFLQPLSMTFGTAGEMPVVQFMSSGRLLTGLSLAKNHATWLILGNDGQLHYLENADELREVQTIEGEFAPATAIELRRSLTREFGPAFEVMTTKHFLVVQPQGRGSKWPETFENLHRQFTSQLKKRGVNVRTGKFPMVAIVMPDSAAFHAELDRQKLPNRSIAGIYIANSNRVYTYDSGMASSTVAVLRHEAAHQSAFNSNIHSRLNATPKWLTEGLGMLFESPAMADGRVSQLWQRTHADAVSRLSSRYQDPQNSLTSDIRRLVAEDVMFDRADQVQDAYSISWLLMFYLCERRPQVFAEFINHTASRPPFVEYEREQRLKDFQSIADQSIDQFALEVTRFLQSIAKQTP